MLNGFSRERAVMSAYDPKRTIHRSPAIRVPTKLWMRVKCRLAALRVENHRTPMGNKIRRQK